MEEASPANPARVERKGFESDRGCDWDLRS